MSSLLPPRRPIVLKTSRDTLVLVAVAGAMTLAIAYSVHNRPVSEVGSTGQTSGEWAGQLADLSPNQLAAPAPAEPLSSEALTLPKTAMALPALPKTLPATKPRTCDGMPCAPVVKTTAASVVAAPPPHRVATATPPGHDHEASLVDKLNPLNHLPAAVTRPFASASDTIVGWVKRF